MKVVVVAAAGAVAVAAIAGSAGAALTEASGSNSAGTTRAADDQPPSSPLTPTATPIPVATPTPRSADVSKPAAPATVHSSVRPPAHRVVVVPAATTAHTVHVWTTGFQTQINACRGGVDMTARYGVRIVGEKWGCGGASFPTRKGALVRLTGLDAGTYRVIGVVAVLNAYVASTSQVPRGYAMLFQTCRGNNAHYTEFIALSRA